MALWLGGGTTAWAQRSDPPQVNKARKWLESRGAASDIQGFLHSFATLRSVEFAGSEVHDDGGFRIWYNYYWKSALSGDINRTQIALDLNDVGFVQRCLVVEDTSALPAFLEAGSMMELIKPLLLGDEFVKKHPDIKEAIENASARQLLILDLNLRRIF